MYVHIISLPDDTEVKAENADEEYIAYPQISAGDNFILALRANGDLYAWGDNTYGQLGLGLGRVGSIDMKPQKLNVTKTVTEITTGADGEDVVTSREVPVKFTKIAAGPDFAMAIDVDGNLYTWGRNNNGQIGNGTDTSDFIDEKNPSEVSNKETLVPSPQMVAYFTDYNVVMQDISAGGSVGNSYAMALSSNGDVFAWGSNKFKQVENSDNEIVSTPVYVPVSRMTSIAAGKGDEFTTSYGVQELGKVLAWGSNENSEMGEGVIDSVTGQAIVSGGGLENIRVLEVAAGNGNAAALTENTTNNSYEYYVWGNNDNYQTGITTNTLPISTPVKNTDMSQTIDITSGNASMMVQKGTGTVNVIGDNTNGKLAVGNNNSVNEIVAAKITDGTDFTGVLAAAVSSNGGMSAFIMQDGSIRTVGNNERGQLGDAILYNELYPVEVYSGIINVDGVDSNNAVLANAGAAPGRVYLTMNQFNVFDKRVTNTNFKATSTNPDVAEIDNDGNITYKSVGSARMVVYEENSGKYSLFDVNVLPNVTDVTTSVQPMVVTGNQFTLALASNGHVYTWGDNSRGQAGFNTTKKTINEPTEVLVNGKPMKNIVSVAAGDNFSLAVDKDGNVWSWGRNDAGVGQLGRKLSSGTSVYSPRKVYDVAPTPSNGAMGSTYLGGENTGKVVKVFASGSTAAAITEEGTVYVWGSNRYGQLGIGHDAITESSASSNKNIPYRMYGIDDAVDVVIGEKNIAIINSDGTVYITGSNETGVLGNGEVWSTGSANNGYNRTIPLPVLDTDMKALTGVVNVALGPEHAILNLYQYKKSTDAEGNDTSDFANEVYAYGNNKNGVLGNGVAYTNGTFSDENGMTVTEDALGNEVKKTVVFPTDKSIARVQAWKSETYVDESGNLLTRDVAEPMSGVYSVFAGDHFSGAVTNSSNVYMWGTNVYGGIETGVLGNKTKNANQYKARLVYKDDTSSDRLDTIVQVSSIINGEHIASISRDGVVYTWGYNNRFQLGDKSQETSVVPVVAGNAKMSIMPPTATLAVDGKTTITITGADMFSVYTDLASSVGTFEWKVLDDSIAKVTVDSQQPKTANITGVTEGETRVVATNTITQQTVFSRIIVTEDITYAQIQLGKDFTVALKKDGTLWAWGNNENGMTGTGSKQSMLTIPVQIDSYYASVNDAAQEIATPMENILSVAVGENHAIIIGQSGKVYAWGDNTYGQLGVNPILIKNTNRPILVELDENFASQIIDVSAGAYHTVAVTATGEVYTWGRNNKGQLGRKTVTEDNDPTNFVPEKMKGVGESNLSGVVM